MGRIVQKYGGSSVRDLDRVRAVARRIADTYEKGEQVVVVLSAQGDTTDRLIHRAGQVNPEASKRELDALLSTGEQVSCALCAMAIQALGCPVVSLTGWQAGVKTDRAYGNARILEMDVERVLAELEQGSIVLVTGFQGVNDLGDITTLGRGGSDTSAVALAAALEADRCQIFTDVEGVFTADPRLVPEARKLEEITFDEMLLLASLGAQVLHDRCVELARDKGTELEVLSSFTGRPGTLVRQTVSGAGEPHLSGLARKTGGEEGTALVSLVGGHLLGIPRVVRRASEALAGADIPLLHTLLTPDCLSLTVPEERSTEALQALHGVFFT